MSKFLSPQILSKIRSPRRNMSAVVLSHLMLMEKNNDVGFNNPNNQQAEQLLKQLSLNPHLARKLRVSDGQLNHKIAKDFADFFLKNTSLIKVSLRDNNFGEGIGDIAQALKKNNSIKELALGEAGVIIDDEQAQDVADLIATNTILEEVFLELEMSPAGVNKIMQALEKNRSLKSFTLVSPPDKTNVEALRNVITNNRSLEYFCIGDQSANLIHSNGIIENALRQNAMLRQVVMVGNQVMNFKNHNYQKIQDTTNDYSAILLARMIKKIKELDPNYDELEQLKNIATRATKNILLKNLTNPEIIAFAQHWHSSMRQNTSLKLRDYANLEWAPLFAETEIPEQIITAKGWKFVPRISALELKKEGQDLQHCVGGYAGACLTGKHHIVSLVNAQGQAVSTIEFILDKNNSLKVRQHHGRENQWPSRQAKLAEEWLVEEIKKQSVPINFAEIEQRKIANESSQQNKVTYMLGFELDKLDHVITAYRNKMLPSGKDEIKQLSQNFLNDFLGKLEIPIADKIMLLPSTLQKDKTPEELLLHKIKAGIQGSTNKICRGLDVTTAVIDDQVFFATHNAQSLEKLKNLFDGKYQEQADGLVVKNIVEVRQTLAQKAVEERKNQKQKPSSIMQNPSLVGGKNSFRLDHLSELFSNTRL